MFLNRQKIVRRDRKKDCLTNRQYSKRDREWHGSDPGGEEHLLLLTLVTQFQANRYAKSNMGDKQGRPASQWAS